MHRNRVTRWLLTDLLLVSLRVVMVVHHLLVLVEELLLRARVSVQWRRCYALQWRAMLWERVHLTLRRHLCLVLYLLLWLGLLAQVLRLVVLVQLRTRWLLLLLLLLLLRLQAPHASR